MHFIDAEAPLEEIREKLSHDTFAASTVGCVIVEGRPGYGRVELDIQPHHHNAMGNVMGGAIFTLADYASAVAMNVGAEPTVSVASTIEYFTAARGDKLIAEATVDKNGRHIVFIDVRVTDNEGTNIARMTSTCYR